MAVASRHQERTFVALTVGSTTGHCVGRALRGSWRKVTGGRNSLAAYRPAYHNSV